VIERERTWPEEPRFVPARWQGDIDAYSLHMSWLEGSAEGRRRTRQNMRQAIRTRRDLESKAAVVEAQETISDPIRMIPCLLDHKAVEGSVIKYETENYEVKSGNVRPTRVPLLLIHSDRTCLIPAGKELWWTVHPDGVKARLHSIVTDPDLPGCFVVLKIMSGVQNKKADALGNDSGPACFSQLTTGSYWSGPLPERDPWTHSAPSEESNSLEEEQ
jgi:hypothetical protein